MIEMSSNCSASSRAVRPALICTAVISHLQTSLYVADLSTRRLMLHYGFSDSSKSAFVVIFFLPFYHNEIIKPVETTCVFALGCYLVLSFDFCCCSTLIVLSICF